MASPVITVQLLPAAVHDVVDAAAGRRHSFDGTVAQSLAQAITVWEQHRRQVLDGLGLVRPAPHHYDGVTWLCLACRCVSEDPCPCGCYITVGADDAAAS